MTTENHFSLFRYYLAGSRVGFQRDLQYRLAAFMVLVGFLIEPVVYLSVWTAVARTQGGSVGGFDQGQLAAYYVVWTLVRVYNTAFDPKAWEWRIREGRINVFLSQPVHMFHRDFSIFMGSKLVWTILWIPIAFVLTLIFRPAIEWHVVNVAAFAVAIWGGYGVRFLVLYVMGMINFWTTRGAAMFGIVTALELIFSGRLVPLQLLPDWAQSLAARMPFRWTFQFPIEVLIGRLEPAEVLTGLGYQFAWATGLGLLFALVWSRAVRRYEAVGN
ncbi:MAG TPA: ABC-2 family transporter protein [Acidimicrobiia bacterium]